MVEFTIKKGQQPPKEMIEALKTLKDEDIVYDEDCPEMTPKMQKAFECAVAQRDRIRKIAN